ncbi:MAG: DUF2442 domain-containing protein [Spirochaetaceae bacterium]|jgi:hypothetical protein|nr:DUF2442 domain-containing protein [Spirochaetaceae bacterium]
MELVHGKGQLCPRVLSVEPTDDYHLKLTFRNGERRLFDAKPLLRYKVFKPLTNIEFFKTVYIANGSIEWPENIDYCPDTLYQESVPMKIP